MVVTTVAGLLSALAAAHGGEHIQLGPGAYPALAIEHVSFERPVTITSADPRRPAVITGLVIRACSGLSFAGLEFSTAGEKAENPFQVLKSSNIEFARLSVHGSLNGDPSDDVAAFLIRNSRNVAIKDSEFQQLQDGVGHLDDDGLTIAGDYFHDMRNDAIRGGGSSHVQIVANRFTDFRPEPRDHDDAIQFWTTNTTEPAHDILVKDNVIWRGAGSAAFQGVFLRDERGSLPFLRVMIDHNLVVGAGYNAIAISHGQDIAITDNIVAAFPDNRSWIRWGDVQNLRMTGNRAELYASDLRQPTPPGNSTIGPVTDGGRALLAGKVP